MVLKKAKELWIVLLAKVLGARRAWIWGLWGSRGARGAPSPWEGWDPSFSQEEMLSWGGGARGGIRQHRHSGAWCMVYLSQNEQRGGKMLGKSPNRRISNSSTIGAETWGPSSLTQSSSG